MSVIHGMMAIVVAALLAGGCQLSRSSGDGRRESFTGTLQGGMMAIGGETSGWVLQREGAEPIELEITAVGHDALLPLDGRRVTIVGRTSEKQYVERGRVPVIVVEKIEPRRD